MSEQNNENLQAKPDDVTMQADGNNVAQTGAVPSGTEDTPASAYEKVIAQQQGVIDALIAQNKQLSDSIQTAIRQGAAFTDNSKPQATPNSVQTGQIGMIPQPPSSMGEPYVPLKDMDFSLKKSDII